MCSHLQNSIPSSTHISIKLCIRASPPLAGRWAPKVETALIGRVEWPPATRQRANKPGSRQSKPRCRYLAERWLTATKKIRHLRQWWEGGRSLRPGLRRKEAMCDLVSKGRISAKMRRSSFVGVSCM